MAFRIGLIGAKLNSGNMGVSALTASLISLIRSRQPDAEVTLLIGNQDSRPQCLQVASATYASVDVANYRLSPRARLPEHIFWILLLACVQRVLPGKAREGIISSNPFLEAVHRADLIGDIRGGDSFSDIYGLGRLVIGSIPVVVAILLKKRIVQLPQTYGPFRSGLGRCIAKYILGRSQYILSRDKEGIAVVRSLIGEGARKTEYCPDVALTLRTIMPYKAVIEPPLPEEPKCLVIGLNINGLMYMGGYSRDNMFGLKMEYREFAAKVALALLRYSDAHLLFVPHTFNVPSNDTTACAEVIGALPESCRNRVHLVCGEYDQSEIKGIIGLCDFFVGSRMHACIAALSQGIPTAAIAYSRKFVGVFESVGMGSAVIDGRRVDADEAVRMVLSMYEGRDNTAGVLAEGVARAKLQIGAALDRILIVK